MRKSGSGHQRGPSGYGQGTLHAKLTSANACLACAAGSELRHLHATTLLLAGVPVHIVAARLGHADPAVTLRVYSHVLREHATGIGEIFAQAVKTPVSKTKTR